MIRTPNQAITLLAYQSAHGPAFDRGLCKRKTRQAYTDQPSDGTPDATAAWGRTKLRLKTTGDKAPRGAILWWTGGSDGHGHAAISDGKGGVWSVDVDKAGYWGHKPFAWFATNWPALRWAGVSRDIDGYTVIPAPAPTTKPQPVPLPPTYLDITIALARFAELSKNPDAVPIYLRVRSIVGRLVKDRQRGTVPRDTAAVIKALETKRAASKNYWTRYRLARVITLLRPLT